jgi:4-hydroxy-2-oxoheptanedioate aldolase
MADETLARHYLSIGALFVAVGVDAVILARQTSALAQKFKDSLPKANPANDKGRVY